MTFKERTVISTKVLTRSSAIAETARVTINDSGRSAKPNRMKYDGRTTDQRWQPSHIWLLIEAA